MTDEDKFFQARTIYELINMLNETYGEDWPGKLPAKSVADVLWRLPIQVTKDEAENKYIAYGQANLLPFQTTAQFELRIEFDDPNDPQKRE